MNTQSSFSGCKWQEGDVGKAGADPFTICRRGNGWVAELMEQTF